MTEEFSLAELARAVWRRKRLVAVIIAACVVAAAVITHFLPKIYRAQTSVFFPQAAETATTAAVGALSSNPALASILGNLNQTSGAAALCKGIAESFSVRAEICRAFDLQRRFRSGNFQDAADKLAGATWVSVTPEGLLAIRVDTTDPRLSAGIANAYDRIVERRYRESSVTRARQERGFLETRTARAQQDLSEAEARLRAYQQRADAILVPEEVPPMLQQLGDVRVDQARAEVELEAIRRQRADAVTQLNHLAAANEPQPSRRSTYAVPWERSSETIADNPDIAALRADLVALEVRIAAFKHNLTEEHPDIKRLQSQIEETRARLAAEARKTIASETRTRSPVYAASLEDLVSLTTAEFGQEARAQGLAQLVRQLESRASMLPERLLQYERLQRDVRVRETVYTTLYSQLEAAKLKELQEQPVFQVLDVAVPPDRHDRPKLVVNVAVGFIFGAFLALAVAAALGAPKTKPAG